MKRAIFAGLIILLEIGMGPARAARPNSPIEPTADAASSETLSWGRFGQVTIYRPTGMPRSVVLFLSGDDGWKLGVTGMAEQLRREGALVAGIDVPHYVQQLQSAKQTCLYPAGEFEDFSHFLESKYRLAEYRYPILVGFSSGASLAYALLTQAPSGTFAGGLSLGFCPQLDSAKPFCATNQFKSTPTAKGKAMQLQPIAALRDPWIVLQGEDDKVCALGAAKAFAAHIGNAELVALPKVGHGYSLERDWLPQFLEAYRKLATAAPQNALPAAPADLAGLPLVEVPTSAGTSDLMALLITGDGGWAGIDQDIARALSAKGVPVVGLNSLKYFWTAHGPDETARDADRILRYYLTRWGKRRAILLGYSQGADVLPFVLNRLTPEVKPRVASAAVIGLGENALFEFHFSNWVHDSSAGAPTRPEVERLAGVKLVCIFGEEEKDSLCPGLDAKKVTLIKLPGGHHFKGDYEKVAQTVLATVPQ